jgi:TonB family protein
MSLRSKRWTIALASLITAASAVVVGQDQQASLSRAKDFYASADYEEALQVLTRLQGASPSIDSTEVAAYQVFCLVALGRSDDATHAIETIVKSDPLYHPSEAQASPRVRTFYESVRRPLLPDIVRDAYAKGKDAYAKRDMPAATAEFDQVIALIDELGSSADPGLSDLRTLASGFRDLSKSAETPTPTPAPAAPAQDSATPNGGDPSAVATPSAPAPAASPAPAVVDASHIFSSSDTDVIKPIGMSQMMPMWNPANPVDKLRDYRGTLELIVDETGKVINATVTRSINAAYDPLLVKAAQQWQFKPASRGGTPVKYRYALDIHLGR